MCRCTTPRWAWTPCRSSPAPRPHPTSVQVCLLLGEFRQGRAPRSIWGQWLTAHAPGQAAALQEIEAAPKLQGITAQAGSGVWPAAPAPRHEGRHTQECMCGLFYWASGGVPMRLVLGNQRAQHCASGLSCVAFWQGNKRRSLPSTPVMQLPGPSHGLNPSGCLTVTRLQPCGKTKSDRSRSLPATEHRLSCASGLVAPCHPPPSSRMPVSA